MTLSVSSKFLFGFKNELSEKRTAFKSDEKESIVKLNVLNDVTRIKPPALPKINTKAEASSRKCLKERQKYKFQGEKGIQSMHSVTFRPFIEGHQTCWTLNRFERFSWHNFRDNITRDFILSFISLSRVSRDIYQMHQDKYKSTSEPRAFMSFPKRDL